MDEQDGDEHQAVEVRDVRQGELGGQGPLGIFRYLAPEDAPRRGRER